MYSNQVKLCRMLNLRPLVQVERTDSRNVRSQIAVDTGALDANQHTKVQTGPIRI